MGCESKVAGAKTAFLEFDFTVSASVVYILYILVDT